MKFFVSHLGNGVHVLRQRDENGDATGPYFVFGPKEHAHFCLMTGSNQLMGTLIEPHEVDQKWLGRMHGIEDGLTPASEVIRAVIWQAQHEPGNAPNGCIVAGAHDVLEVFGLLPATIPAISTFH